LKLSDWQDSFYPSAFHSKGVTDGKQRTRQRQRQGEEKEEEGKAEEIADRIKRPQIKA
jgi:hypothetical protein